MNRNPMYRSGVSTTNLILGGMLWTAVLIAIGLTVKIPVPQTEDGVESRDEDAAEANAGIVLQPQESSVKIGFPAKELPDFEFPECMGGTVSRDSLKGHVWVASFVFTRCATTCPMITKEVMELHRRVASTSPEARFVSFSVDSSFDTAEVLQKYAEIYSADHNRWKFVTGDELAIHQLIGEGFALYVKPNIGESRKPGFEVAHSNRVVLVNEDSIPVATFLATRPEDMVRLRRILEGKDEFPQPAPIASLTISPGGGGGGDAQPPLNIELRPADSDSELVPDAGTEHDAETDADAGTDGDVGDAALNDRIDQLLPAWVKRLPPVNAGLNSASTLFLVAGYLAIRKGNRNLHRNLMVSAFGVSVIFLLTYVIYHAALGEYTGERGRRFVGSAAAAVVYRSILIPHVILAVFVPFLAIRVFQHAFRERWEQHRRLAGITLPIWLFVSVTGVIIYWMLYHWPWRAADAAVS